VYTDWGDWSPMCWVGQTLKSTQSVVFRYCMTGAFVPDLMLSQSILVEYHPSTGAEYQPCANHVSLRESLGSMPLGDVLEEVSINLIVASCTSPWAGFL